MRGEVWGMRDESNNIVVGNHKEGKSEKINGEGSEGKKGK